jgi:lysophospholipase L1-like esterase
MNQHLPHDDPRARPSAHPRAPIAPFLGAAMIDPMRRKIAALGDSITAGSPLWDPDPEVRRTIGSALDERSQWEWWAAGVSPELEFVNCGVYGERAAEIERRLEACAAGADALVVQGGINDVAQGRPVEDAAAALRRMVRRGRELGLGVALADVLPWNNGWPGAEQAVRRLNELVHAIGRAEGVPVLPFHATLEDPERPGRMREEWTDDGDHPSVEGYRRLGELAFRRP